MKVKVVAKAGSNLTVVMNVVHQEFDVVTPVFIGTEHTPAEQEEIAKKLVEEDDQALIFTNPNDFPILMAAVAKEVAWERGYWSGANHEARKHLKLKNVKVYIIYNDSLYRLV